MFFRMVYDEKLAQAAYLIGCQGSGDAIVIDPQRDVDRYIDLAKSEKFRITAVTETHIHADFLSGVRELAERTGAKVYVSDEGGPDWRYRWLEKARGGGSYKHQLLRHGDTLRVGAVELRIVHTPGHTPEHISFLVTDTGGGAGAPMGMVTGDFVFVGDIGRPDLLETAAGLADTAEPAARQLFRSTLAFKELPDYLQVWPAHGAGSACGKALGAVPQSTIGYEKRFNPAMQAADDEERFLTYVLQGQPEPPLYFARMKRDNRDGPPLLGALPRPKLLGAAGMASLDGKRVAILDTRPWDEFRSGHLPGSLFAPLNKTFPTVAGSYVEEGTPVYLVVDGSRVEEAVRDLVRIGLDNVVGYASPDNIRDGACRGGEWATAPEVDVTALQKARAAGDVLILDVRRATEYEAGHIPGAVNIAHTRLLARKDEVPRDRPIMVHCQGGTRSAFATALLRRYGYDATNLAGGYAAWVKAGGETQR